MDIIKEIVYQMKEKYYTKMTLDKMILNFKALEIDIDEGISMDDLIKVAETFGFRWYIKLFFPMYENGFEFKTNIKSSLGFVYLFFVYRGKNKKLEIIKDESLIKSIKYGNLNNIKNYVYKFENEINTGDYTEIICNDFIGIVEDRHKYSDELFLKNFKKVNFIYGDEFKYFSNKKGAIYRNYSFNKMLNELYDIGDITDIDQIGSICCVNILGNDIYFIYNQFYIEVRRIYEILKNRNDKYNFIFNNNSYNNIFSEMYKIENNEELIKMSYNDEIFDIVDNFGCKGLIGENEKVSNKKYKYGWDKCKSYTYGCMRMKNEKIGIITRFDNLREFNKELNIGNIKLGWYLIENFEYDELKFGTSFMPCFFVKYLIENNVKFKVLKWVESKRYFRFEKICKVIEKLYEILYDKKVVKKEKNVLISDYEMLDMKFEGDEFVEYNDGNYKKDLKNIVNFFIGTLNCKSVKNKFSFLSNDTDISYHYETLGYKMEAIDSKKNLDLIHFGEEEKLKRNRCLIYNSVICLGYMNLIDGIKMVREKYDIDIINYNTDGFSFYCDKIIEKVEGEKGGYKEILNDFNYKIGCDLFKENKKVVEIKEGCAHFENPDEDEEIFYKPRRKKLKRTNDLLKSRIMIGAPGSSKTYSSLNSLKKFNVICLGYSNKSVENMDEYLKLFLMLESESMTIHRFLGQGLEGKDENKKGFNFSKYDYIFIDEFFMVPERLMNDLIERLIDFKGKIIFSGDVCQNGYFIKQGYKYNYLDCDIIKELTDFNIIEKEIEIGKCRYTDENMIKFLEYFRKFRENSRLG